MLIVENGQDTDVDANRDRRRVVVFAPSPLVTVTIERATGSGDAGPVEIHLHGGGQGVWIARMLALLGCRVQLCGPVGGETGEVFTGLIARDSVEFCTMPVASANGAYVHDRRSGDRRPVAQMHAPALSRHDLDRLYDLALVSGLDADAVVLAGPDDEQVLPAETYRRLAADLHEGRGPVVVDLAGEFLRAAVEGGVTLAKASSEDLVAAGQSPSEEPADVIAVMRGFSTAGAENVVVSRADQPGLALLGERLLQVQAPAFERVDHRGAGDSMTAAIAAGLAAGAGLEQAVRLGAAAGALNTTHRGLGTGDRDVIDRLTDRVVIEQLTD